MKRILILMAEYGYGHRSAANAIAAALKETHGDECVVEVVNPMNEKGAPPFLKKDQANYDRTIRQVPELYRLGYHVSDSSAGVDVMTNTTTLLLSNVLKDLLKKHNPDVIVCTYPLYQTILQGILKTEKRQIPIFVVVTDLATVHQMWFNPSVYMCLVPTKTVYDLAVSSGISPEKVKITGLPVHPELAKGTEDQAAIRETLGWRKDLFTVLAIGSKRVENLYDSMNVLNHSGLPLQLAIVAGGDDTLYQRLKDTEWHQETHLYNYVSDMPTLLRASDGVLGKAGGLTVTETLAVGLPLIMVSVIPGQESGNADYVVNGGAGDLAKNPVEVLEVMSHWLANGKELYNQRVQNAHRLGYPRAAYDVADLVWTAAQESDNKTT